MRELHPRIKFKRYEVTRSSSYLEQIIKGSQSQSNDHGTVRAASQGE
jgi:hypothetical protein